MATPLTESFEGWLTEKLTSVSSDIDTDVFVSYIIGILDTEDDSEEKMDGISGFLEGIMDSAIASQISKSILDEWMVVSERNKENEATNDIGDRLSEMMEQHKIATVKEKQLTEEEKSRKAAILKHYGEVSDLEESDDDDEFGDDASDRHDKHDSNDGLVKNVNKMLVEKGMKEAREKAKQDTEKRKEKDKQDRQAQKQKSDERKQAEKKRTQKGERRR